MLQLSVGARAMFLRNLWAEVGLCNGAIEEVKSLIHKENVIPPSLLIAVFVEF